MDASRGEKVAAKVWRVACSWILMLLYSVCLVISRCLWVSMAWIVVFAVHVFCQRGTVFGL